MMADVLPLQHFALTTYAMKITLPFTPIAGTFKHWSRVARRTVALGLAAAGLGSAHAQFAISTYGGAALTSGNTNTGTGPATVARFNNPAGIAVDSTGTNMYIADAANHLIRKVVIASGITSTLAGSGSALATNGTGTGASFSSPQGVAIDSTNTNLYVADTGNHLIRKIVISTGVVTTLAGNAGVFTPYADATGVAATFNSPLGVIVGPSDTNLYVADTGNHSIRQVVISTGAVTTFAGSNAGATSGTTDNVTGTSARFNQPSAIASDGTNLYVTDRVNNAIRKIVIGTQAVTTLAGTIGSATASTDGTGSAARFNLPGGIVAKGANVYVTDTGNSTLRQIVTATGVTTTLAGTALAGGTADGVGATARFQGPTGIGADASSNLYIADTNSQTIRFGGPAIAPGIGGSGTNASTTVGGSASFTISGVTGNPTPTYQWQRQPVAGGGFSNLSNTAPYSGVTTATLTINPATLVMSGDQFQCVVSNTFGSSATSTFKTLTVQQAPAITSANSTSFNLSAAGTFTVTATGSGTMTFSVIAGSFPSWASIGSSSGIISGTPPNTTSSPFTFTIQASNGVGSPATQSFTLTVAAGPSITSQPGNQTVGAGASAQFSVTATSATSYQWLRQPAAGGGFSAITDNGIYSGSSTATLTVNNTTLAMSGDQFQVNVTNSVGTTPSSTASLSITQAPNITSLNTATFVENSSGTTFTVQATGSPAPTYTLTGGSLPNGLNLNSATGVVSGTPAVGTSATSPYSLQFTATNGVLPTSVQNFTLAVSPTALVPAFTTQPSNLTVALGQTATFTVVATGTPTPTYRWQRQLNGGSGFTDLADDSTFSGTGTGTLTITNPSSGMSGDQFRCVATNTSGNTASSAASLTVVIGTTISTFAGSAGSFGSTDGAGSAARFNAPSSVAIDSSGNVYVADTSNNVIRKVTSAGVVTTLAGTAGSNGNADGLGAAARFNGPSGIAVDSAGNLYVADTYNHTIRAISADGTVTTLAGLAGNSGTADGAGSIARFSYPAGVAVSASTVYVADTSNHTIRKIVGNTVTTFAGAAGVHGNTDSPARFYYPNSLVADSSGNVYVADSFNYTIRKITSGGSVSTFAGIAGTAGIADGTGTAASFNQPSGVGVDSAGNVYVADTFNDTLRKITAGGVVTTVAGSPGVTGSVDGTGTSARFYQPYGIAVDSSGNIYIADTRSHTIRRSGSVSAPTIQTQPQNRSTVVGQNVTFTVTATGAPTPAIFQWQRQPAGTSGFVNLSNGSTYSGVTTATLTVTGATTGMNGDQFKVIVSNLISPEATSNAATLTTITPAVFTSAASATFNVGQAGTFNVTTTSDQTVAYSATGLPSWLTLNASSGVLSGTPPDAAGSPISITITANNGTTATQTFTLTVVVPVIAPTISVQPVGVTVNRGATAALSVTAAGTAPFTYQWSKAGVAVTGATSSTLTIGSVEPSSAGIYTVTVTNSVGSATSNPATVVVTAAPVITTQPRAQSVIAGSSVSFSVIVTGAPSPTYQWRLNGAALSGATNSTLAITGAQVANAGNYDVVVTNPLGLVVSSVAQLTVSATATAPQITSQPASRTALLSASTTFTVAAASAPAPGYQWRKSGSAISGATSASYTVGFVQASDAGNYDVVVTNSAGAATSATATLTVIRRSYAGTYFGSFGSGLGSFAIYIRADNTGVFLGFIPGSSLPVKNLNFVVNDTGQFSFTQNASGGISASSVDGLGAPRAAAVGDFVFAGNIANDGALSGTVTGVTGASLSATKSSDVGSTQSVAGFYQAGSPNTSSTLLSIAGATGQAFVLTQTSAVSDGGTGTVDSTGRITVGTTRQIVSVTINSATSTLAGSSVAGNTTTTYSGASEAVLATQRLGNISTRANVGTGANVAIAGFVISGTESKPVLIRAIGPTMSVFGFTNALAAPKLELFSGSTVIASNTGWASAPNTAAIVAASAQSGAFALSATSADSVIFTTLAPGTYTGVVSSANGASGVALVEVYDLSAPAAGQKLFNISTRALAGTGTSALAAGFVINGSVPKRVLVRAVGPGLVQFGFPGALLQTQLQVFNGSNQVVAQNSGWGTSADATLIATVATQVGAFPLVSGSGDSAVILNLAPGSYTAQVNPIGVPTSGVAIIEVYELP